MMMVGDLMESACQHDGTEKAFTECVHMPQENHLQHNVQRWQWVLSWQKKGISSIQRISVRFCYKPLWVNHRNAPWPKGSKQVLGRGGNYSEKSSDFQICHLCISVTDKKNSMLAPSILSTWLRSYKNSEANREENDLF